MRGIYGSRRLPIATAGPSSIIGGGARGDRTPDLYNAIVALYHLSYGPVCYVLVHALSLCRIIFRLATIIGDGWFCLCPDLFFPGLFCLGFGGGTIPGRFGRRQRFSDGAFRTWRIAIRSGT